MAINLLEQHDLFLTTAPGWTNAFGKTENYSTYFKDDRIYTMYAADPEHEYSFLFTFDFGIESLTNTPQKKPIGSNVGLIKVDFKTNDAQEIVGLNPVFLETNKQNDLFDGIVLNVVYESVILQVRYKADASRLGVVMYGGIFETNGQPFTGNDDLKTILLLPDEFDIIATTMNLLTQPGDIESLRQNPFVITQTN